MNSKEFVHWMRGFVTACPKFHPTPEQWDLLVETLHKVKLEEPSTVGDGSVTIAKGIPYTFGKVTTGTVPEDSPYSSGPGIWYGTGTPPDFMMGYTNAVDKEVDKILRG